MGFASTYKQNLNTTITQMIYGDNDLKKFKKKKNDGIKKEFETMITNYIYDIIPNYIKVICTVINIGNVKIRKERPRGTRGGRSRKLKKKSKCGDTKTRSLIITYRITWHTNNDNNNLLQSSSQSFVKLLQSNNMKVDMILSMQTKMGICILSITDVHVDYHQSVPTTPIPTTPEPTSTTTYKPSPTTTTKTPYVIQADFHQEYYYSSSLNDETSTLISMNESQIKQYENYFENMITNNNDIILPNDIKVTCILKKQKKKKKQKGQKKKKKKKKKS